MRIILQFYFLVRPYWANTGAMMSWLLLAGSSATTLGVVWVSVQYTQWSRTFYDAMADLFQQASPWQLAIEYAGLTTFFVLLVVGGRWLKKQLIIHWRQRMTRRYQALWLRRQTHYRLRHGSSPDNPDQRIAEDIRLLTEQSITLFLSLLKNITSLLSFIVILWQLSGTLQFSLWGMKITLHGYLVWVALIYATVSSLLAHWLGHPLHRLNGDKQRAEADYRASLLHVRENSEQIALYRGEHAELRRMNGIFSVIVTNWRALMLREFKLDSFITGYFRLSLMLPLFAVLPLYIAKQMTLGAVMQARGAFGYVLDAFGWFIDSYRELAAWSATVERLWQFQQSAVAVPPRLKASRTGRNFICRDFSPCNVEGQSLFMPISHYLMPGDWLLITGDSGLGKTSLLRGLAGLHNRVEGEWQLPLGRQLFIPQRSYLPADRLDNLLTYPGVGNVDRQRLHHALQSMGLARLIPSLAEKKSWGTILSGGEQQRLFLARAIVNQPMFLCMDEVTSNLDEETAGLLLSALKLALPHTIVIAVSHQHGLQRHFSHHCRIVPAIMSLM